MRYMCITYLLFATLATNGQLLTNDGSIISTTENATLTVWGDVWNKGNIINEGNIQLNGDWTNVGSYSSESGAMSVIGISTIDNESNEISNLSIDASGGVFITSDLTITNSLSLVNGMIILADDTELTLGQNAVLNGGTEDSYINGALFLPPSEDLFFPVGTDNHFTPFSLKGVMSDTLIGVKTFSGSTESAFSSALDSISPNRYWHLQSDSSFSARQMSLPVIGEDFIASVDEATVASTPHLDLPFTTYGDPLFTGTLTAGTVVYEAPIRTGYYLLADRIGDDPPIKVINVVTSLQDGKHDFLRIENVEFYENNLVEVFDRLGNKVFEMRGYNNRDRVFRGKANVGARDMLTTGNYYYTIRLTAKKRASGFVYIKN